MYNFILINRDYVLYDEVYSFYGPFYYLFYGYAYQIFAKSVTHDAVRAVCVFVQIACVAGGGRFSPADVRVRVWLAWLPPS